MRRSFGGTPDAAAEDRYGNRLPAAIGTAWNGPGDDAGQVTDLSDPDGTPRRLLVADGQGMIRAFLGPDDDTAYLWVDFGHGRYMLPANDTNRLLAEHVHDDDPHGGSKRYVTRASVGKPGGVAALDANGRVPAEQLPPVSGLPQLAARDSSTVRLTGDGSPEHPLTASLWAGIYSRQRKEPKYRAGTKAVPFTREEWPPFAFDGPDTGTIRVHVTAALENRATATSSIWLGFALRPDPGLTHTLVGLSVAGGRAYATRMVILPILKPGTTYTLTPWYMASSVDRTTSLRYGSIYTEAIARPWQPGR